jgi:hypothetical protein
LTREDRSGESSIAVLRFSTSRGELANLLTPMTQSDELRRIRFWLAVFMAGLILSGVTAFPLRTEIGWLNSVVHAGSLQPVAESTGLYGWIERVHEGIDATGARYPFLAYGTDWLAFAHLVIAIAFLGPYLDPVRNKWVIQFGLIACGGVIPLALIAGHVRQIPLVGDSSIAASALWGRFLFCSVGGQSRRSNAWRRQGNRRARGNTPA